MKLTTMSIFVDDQTKARAFYTDVLGFVVRDDVPLGEFSWLTVADPDAPDGPVILLEPANHPAVGPFRDALIEDGIPWTQFGVDDAQAEYDRLLAHGVRFTQPPTDLGPVTAAVFDDTVGNLIQLVQQN